MIGPFLLNAVFARRAGVRYRPMLDWHDEGLHEWVRLSLPLIIGVSLVTADNWIIAHFASNMSGAISLITYAKLGFTAPMAMLAQAAGVASMPFFASLWAKQHRFEFATSGGGFGVSRDLHGIAGASAMVALGKPAIDLLFTGGRFSAAEASVCFSYFAVFSLSVFLWSAQAIYSRAFMPQATRLADGRRDDRYGVYRCQYMLCFSLVRGHGTGIRVGYRDRDADPDDCRLAASAAHGFIGGPRLPRIGAVPGWPQLASGAAVWAAFFSWMAASADAENASGRAQPLARVWLGLVAGLAALGRRLLSGFCTKTGSALPKVMMKRLRLA